ncbi:MAG: Gfo/Idh/MocA family oxidoreductase, partial [Enterobacteriaceae bacterium]|nr:Gfo/Idh/MocA family oxidoreductase [Enterobacteriaceae bacterium]
AQLGCGLWGKNLIRNFHNLKSLKYIYDIDKSKVQLIKEKYNIQYLDLDAILNDINIKGIVIASPIDTHFKLAKLALKKNKDVFIEKPIAMNVKETQILKKISEKNNKIIMVGHILQYHPIFIKLKKILRHKNIGTIKEIYCSRLNNLVKNPTNSILLDYAPHDISAALELAKSEPYKIDAICKKFIEYKEIDVSINIKFKNNINCKINLSWTNETKKQEIKIVTNKNIIIFDDTLNWENKLTIYSNTEMHKITVKKKEPLLNECEYFLACIKNRKQPLSNCQESIKIMKIIESIKKIINKQTYNLKLL